MKYIIGAFLAFLILAVIPLLDNIGDETVRWVIALSHLSVVLPSFILFVEKKFPTLSLLLSTTLSQFLFLLCKEEILCLGEYQNSVESGAKLFFFFSVAHLFLYTTMAHTEIQMLTPPLLLISAVFIDAPEIQGIFLTLIALVSMLKILQSVKMYHVEDLVAFFASTAVTTLLYFLSRDNRLLISLYAVCLHISFSLTIDMKQEAKRHFLFYMGGTPTIRPDI